jgi:microcystin-dependent protein
MADVTISQLTPRQPTGAALVPYSEGGTTYSATVTQVISLASNIPAGGIILWSGAANAIPSGWVLCDGNNSTPNLVDKFVLGAGTTTPAKGTTGGSKDAIVVSHTHDITDPGHVHSSRTANSGAGYQSRDTALPAAAIQSTNYNISPVGVTNTTGITINSQGSSGVNANMPPYYALCYIMKQ